MSESTNPTVRIETSMGEFVLELDAVNAPITVANFLDYANDGFYEGTIFHRVIDGFMIQCGGLTADMRDKDSKKAPIKLLVRSFQGFFPIPLQSVNGQSSFA